jgi:hypothetical protein
VFRRPHPTAAVVAFLTLPIAAARFEPPQDAKAPQAEAVPTTSDDPEAVAKTQLKISRQALDMIRRSNQLGAPIINQRRDVYRWSRRLLSAQLYLSLPEDQPRTADPEVYLSLSKSTPTPERTTAFQDHLDRMRQWESDLRPLYERGILSTLDFLEIQASRLEAEFWLTRER